MYLVCFMLLKTGNEMVARRYGGIVVMEGEEEKEMLLNKSTCGELMLRRERKKESRELQVLTGEEGHKK